MKPSRTLTRADLATLACNGQEKIIAQHASELLLNHVAQFSTDSERQFVFRCFWVPFEIIGVFQGAFLSAEGRPWNLPQFALMTAHSRMLREMRAWGHCPCQGWWSSETAAEASLFWMRRYDAHLHAIGKSFQEWVKRKCPDCRHPQQELATAAFFGFMQRVDKGGLPSGALAEVLSELKRRERNGSRESDFFYKTARDRSKTRWPLEEIDLWLIEVWPLVREYEWTYRDVLDFLEEKSNLDDRYENTAISDNKFKYLKKRCAALGLDLSKEAQQTRGRPSEHAGVAPGLDTFRARLRRQVSRLRNQLDPQALEREALLQEKFAEMAVDLEPFTSLIQGDSKESFALAPPNLKRGLKKASSGPPFFGAPVT